MNYNIYHTELDSFIHEKEESERFHHDEHYHVEHVVNMRDKDINILMFCHVMQEARGYKNSLHPVHKTLYDYLVDVGLEHIRFVPLSEDDSLDYRYSFTLNEWD
jgi:hypothetical protein